MPVGFSFVVNVQYWFFFALLISIKTNLNCVCKLNFHVSEVIFRSNLWVLKNIVKFPGKTQSCSLNAYNFTEKWLSHGCFLGAFQIFPEKLLRKLPVNECFWSSLHRISLTETSQITVKDPCRNITCAEIKRRQQDSS